MVKFTRNKADVYRILMNKAVQSLDDSDALEVPMMFELWEPDKDYVIGQKVRYEDVLYKVLIDHTSRSHWPPDTAVSLYTRVLIPDPTVIPDWIQPDSTNAYMIGDKVRHNEKIWVSIVDYNVWEPGVYGWEENT